MEEKVIIAKFGKTKVAQTEKQWRYNHGQKLKFEGVDLPANYEVHFSNSKTGTAKTMIGNADGVLIPQEYFVPGEMIYAWVYVEEDGVGVTRREVRIPIDQKARPTDQQPLPEEQTVIEQAIEALNDAVDEIPNEITTALAEAKASGLYDGTNIWWTYERISSGAPDYDGGMRKRDLHGKEGEDPLVGDFVYGPDVRSDGVITDLYVIAQINGPLIYLTHLDRIVGDDGFSPEVEIEQITNGHRVTIIDAEGSESFDVMNGEFDVTGDLSMENYRLTELADGVDDADAVNKAQVDRMIREGSGLFRGSFSTKASLNMAAWQSTDPTRPYYVDNNDYCVVLSDETQHYECWRYGYVVGSGWAAQYRINEAPMTAAQIAAINSGITADRLVGLEQFKNAGQPKLNGIESGAQVNKIEAIRAVNASTGLYEELPITNKTVDIPQQGAIIFDFVYDLNNDEMVVFPTLDEVQAAGPSAVARFKFFGISDEIYIPVADNLGTFFSVLSEDTAYSIYYTNNTWAYEELPIGGGASNYSDLPDKPSINNVTLSGNKSLSDLGIEPEAFVVTITNSGGSYLADKTYTQIVAAATAGKRVVATIDDVYFSYYGLVNGADALFYNLKQFTGSFWSISSSNVLTHYTSTAGNYSKPVSGIPKTDLASTVQASLGKADTAYQKPSGGIPATDLASGVIPTVPSASSATPQALGTAAAGSSTDYARADHVHAKPSAADVGAVASNQGSGNAGKFLVVGNDGNVTAVTMSAWQGGSY